MFKSQLTHTIYKNKKLLTYSRNPFIIMLIINGKIIFREVLIMKFAKKVLSLTMLTVFLFSNTVSSFAEVTEISENKVNSEDVSFNDEDLFFNSEVVDSEYSDIISSNEFKNNTDLLEYYNNNSALMSKVALAKAKPGPWKTVKYMGSKSRKLTKPYRREKIIQTISYGLSFVTAGGSYLLGIAESIYREKVYDIYKYGGVYTKTYYRRQITDIKNSKTNVPVPYRYEYVTYFYSSPKFNKIVYTQRVSDGIRLANN